MVRGGGGSEKGCTIPPHSPCKGYLFINFNKICDEGRSIVSIKGNILIILTQIYFLIKKDGGRQFN